MDFWTIIVITLAVELIPCFYALARNKWVFENRIRILAESDWDGKSHIPYDSLPSYEEMLQGHGFWIWNINYYLCRR